MRVDGPWGRGRDRDRDRGSLPGNRHPERQRRNVGRPIKRKAPLNCSFPLEGKCHVVAKGCTRVSIPMKLTIVLLGPTLADSRILCRIRAVHAGAVKNVNHFFAALFVCLYFRLMAAGSQPHGHLEGNFMSAAGQRGLSTMETLSREISCRHALAAMRT